MDDETDITQSLPAAGPAPPAAPPPAGPPRRSPSDDVWPWLIGLLVLVVGALLVWLFVFHNGKNDEPVVPAVVGMQQNDAIKRLTDDGYGVKAFVEPASRPRGIVVSQAPGGGSQLRKGATVTLHISNGRRLGVTTAPTKTTTATTSPGTTTAPAATAKVPDVVGQDMASGAGQIEAAGFVSETSPVTSASVPDGQIVQEAPAAGSQAPAGSAVQLQVAAGSSRSQVQVPDVVGQKAGAARATLMQAKLTVRTEYRKGAAKDAGVVLAQAPAAGTGAPAYTQVTITVGQ
jgi:eukaryotic-like serine/threonine-protein kinase